MSKTYRIDLKGQPLYELMEVIELSEPVALLTLHSEDPEAIKAVALTLEMLTHPGYFLEVDGKLVKNQQGEYVVYSQDPAFIVFACRQQGYAKDARVLTPDTEELYRGKTLTVGSYAIPWPLVEAYGLHKGLCLLGFSPEEIFVSVSQAMTKDSEQICPSICVHLRTQEKEFLSSVAPWLYSNELFIQHWKNLCAWIRVAPESSLETIWKASIIGNNVDALAAIASGIMYNGIRVPNIGEEPS